MINFNKLIEPLLDNQIVKTTYYYSPTQTIKATRKRFGKKILKRYPVEVLLTIGKPNYTERLFIKQCLKAGVSFPIKKVQLKWYKKV